MSQPVVAVPTTPPGTHNPAWRVAAERFIVAHPVWTIVILLAACSVLVGWIPTVGGSIGAVLWIAGIVAAMIWREQLKKTYPDSIPVKTPRVAGAAKAVSAPAKNRNADSGKTQAGATKTRSGLSIVRVTFHDLDDPGIKHPEEKRGYCYAWPLPGIPVVGDRVLVPGMDGLADAEIVGFGLTDGITESELKSVARLTLSAEAARVRDQAYLDAWLDSACRAVGLPAKTRQKKWPKEYYPDPPPTNGSTSRDKADEYGRIWWRIAKNARDKEEEQAFYRVAHHWYKIRDAS